MAASTKGYRMNAPRERDLKAVEKEFARAFCERGPIDEDYSQTPTIGYRYSCGEVSGECHTCSDYAEALSLSLESNATARRERDQLRGWARCLIALVAALAVAVAVLLRAAR